MVAEIEAAGGRAVADTEAIGTWGAGERLVQRAIDTFGDLHVLVNNAGNVGGGMLADLDEKRLGRPSPRAPHGHLCHQPLRGGLLARPPPVGARPSGLDHQHLLRLRAAGIVGQTAYGAAKAGVLLLSLVSAAELAEIGVRVNAICPAARTRLTTAGRCHR